MDENRTYQLILQYVYGESDPTSTLIVKNLLETDAEALRYFEEVIEIVNCLETIKEEPHPTTVAIISEHSHDSHTEAV